MGNCIDQLTKAFTDCFILTKGTLKGEPAKVDFNQLFTPRTDQETNASSLAGRDIEMGGITIDKKPTFVDHNM